jgi:hypothetical protein
MFIVLGKHRDSEPKYLGCIYGDDFDGEEVDDIIGIDYKMEEIAVYRISDKYTVEKQVSYTINEV